MGAFNQTGIGRLLIVFVCLVVPFSFIHLYTRNIVSAALLKRDIHLAGLKKEQLLKKNMALKEAIGKNTGRNLVLPPDGLPFSENNKIVRVRLPGLQEAAERRFGSEQL